MDSMTDQRAADQPPAGMGELLTQGVCADQGDALVDREEVESLHDLLGKDLCPWSLLEDVLVEVKQCTR
jgi:hypothetical protein